MMRNFTKMTKLFGFRSINNSLQRPFHANINKNSKWSKMIVVGGASAIIGGLYLHSHISKQTPIIDVINTVCATLPASQPNIISQPKKHALYLTIHLKHDAKVKDVLKVVSCLERYIDLIVPKDLRDEDDEILAGVAFGPNFLAKVRPSKSPPTSYAYHERKGIHGSMPSTGGDIFIHAKSNEFSKVFELAQTILKNLPANSVESFEDVYGWVYRNGRDLSGFIDGTENPADDEHRASVAVNPDTGGSYAITQKWIHRHDVIDSNKDSVMEGWVGRKRLDSTELGHKSTSSHVARMTGGPNFGQTKKFEIVRQSQPFGSLSGESGLFFIGYSAKVEALDYMLDRMVGASEDGLSDDIMRLSKCVKSTYWYFPGQEELLEMLRK